MSAYTPPQSSRPADQVLPTYARASGACPRRAEALHAGSRLCRLNNDFTQGYALAKQGLAVSPPGAGLFVEQWIYDYGLLDELAVNAYWVGFYQDCFDACDRILREGKCPAGERPRIEANADSARQKLAAGSVAAEQVPAPI